MNKSLNFHFTADPFAWLVERRMILLQIILVHAPKSRETCGTAKREKATLGLNKTRCHGPARVCRICNTEGDAARTVPGKLFACKRTVF